MSDAAKAEAPTTGVTPGNVETSPAPRSKSSSDVASSVGDAHRGTTVLGDHAQAHIGHRLRSLYDSILQQPVPDRFRDLIDRLDAQEPKAP